MLMRSKLTLNKCSLVMMAAGAAIIASPALALNIFVAISGFFGGFVQCTKTIVKLVARNVRAGLG